MSFRKHVLLGLALAALAAPGSAHATAGLQYVRLRNSRHCDTTLTYAAVQTDPSHFAGRTLELRGVVGGTIGQGDGLSIMLNLDDRSAPTLDIPPAEAPVVREFVTPHLRVLAQVGESASTGNVTQLKVIAVAHESEVAAVERAEGERQRAIQQQEARRQAELDRWKRVAERAVHRHGASAEPAISRGEVFLPSRVAAASPPAETPIGLSERARPLFAPYFGYIAHCNTRLSAADVGQITFHLLNFADRYNVDPRLVVSMIIAESNFNPAATSRTGAMGLGQLMPGTARALGVSDAYDPVQNLGGAINYLRSRLDTFAEHSAPGGEVSFEQAALAMAAYNAGAGAVRKYHGIPPYRETQAYVRRVMGLYRQLCQ